MLVPVGLLTSRYSTLIIVILAIQCTLSASDKVKNRYFDKTLPEQETVLTEEDFRRVKQRQRRQILQDEQQETTDDDTAMYNRERFEGDIVNPGLLRSIQKGSSGSSQDDMFNKSGGGILQHNAVRGAYLKWPGGVIPYTVSKQYLVYGRDQIAQAIEEYTQKTCIRFRPKTDSDVDYVHLFPDDGCYSLVGKVGGKQPISLGDGCMSKGIMIHELMHAVGFFHEQSRADRDEYVNINWDNIEPDLRDQFDKYSLYMIDYLGTKYDLGSVMHYGKYAFSKNGRPTIQPKDMGKTIGQRVGFSPTDLYKVNKLYGCPNTPSQPPSNGDPPASAPSSSGSASSVPVAASMPVSISAASSGGGTNSCEDQRQDCGLLARGGHCESMFTGELMQMQCARSCGKCGGGSMACADLRDWCPRWAASGLCDLYMFQPYMHSNCPFSCAQC